MMGVRRQVSSIVATRLLVRNRTTSVRASTAIASLPTLLEVLMGQQGVPRLLTYAVFLASLFDVLRPGLEAATKSAPSTLTGRGGSRPFSADHHLAARSSSCYSPSIVMWIPLIALASRDNAMARFCRCTTARRISLGLARGARTAPVVPQCL